MVMPRPLPLRRVGAGNRPATGRRTVTTNKGGKSGTRAPEQTFEEVRYLKYLIENAIPVRIKLEDGEVVAGVIEYYDHSFIRVTRKDAPNLFIYKHDIKYFEEGA
jgi:sRNA-binding regulator protein Hfq